MWWLVFPALVAALLAVLLIRAALFKPRAEERPAPEAAAVDGDKAISDLQQLIRCKTVSFRETELIDQREFEKLRELIKTLFPHVHEACTLEFVPPTGLLFHLKGTGDGEPSVFMAHYDVVPVDEAAWEKPPFEGLIEDGVLWGRGTLDTKGTFCGVLEAAETLLAQGFVPQNDMYFAFAGDEEVSGITAPAIVELFEKRGIHPAFVIDEGGAVVDDMFPGVKQPCALVGTGEKGLMAVEFKYSGKGGHASAPPPHTPVGVLAQAVVNIENHPFPSRLTPPAAGMFDTLGRRSTFVYRLIFSNLWLFKPVLDSMCRKKGGEMNALMRTTCAFTQMKGSKATNVIPPEATVGANLRLVEGDTMDSALARLKTLCGSDDIQLRATEGNNASVISSTDCDGWRRLKSAIEQTWPDALVSPYLMVACSDSRHYGRISDKVYRFSAMALSKEERGYIHGNNERIPTDKIITTVQFYVRLMRMF